MTIWTILSDINILIFSYWFYIYLHKHPQSGPFGNYRYVIFFILDNFIAKFGPNTNRIVLDDIFQPMTGVLKCGKLLENMILVLCPLYTYTYKNTPLLVGYTMFLHIN